DIGDIVRYAVNSFPKVRAVHFQPVTHLGRYPGSYDEKITLDELMKMLCVQSGIDPMSLLPSRCDHALCEFHGTFVVGKDKKLLAASNRNYFTKKKKSSAAENRDFVAAHWSGNKGRGAAEVPLPEELSMMDFDSFLYYMKNGSMTISAMAFQDAMDMDLDRLANCSLLVYEDGRLIPFCSKYLTPMKDDK
ncbi:MAG: radical SAM protein, partial [Firmicutes bacterium]|nr:radical SAM protein [Bacillota bacterium]